MFKTIKTKLVILFVLLFLVTLGSVGGFVDYETKQQINTDVVSQTKGIAAELSKSTGLFLSKYSSSLEQMAMSDNAARYVLKAMENPDAAFMNEWNPLNKDFTNYTGLYEDVSSIYIAVPNKELQIVPAVDLPEDFDPTSRDWYKEAVAKPGKVIWSEPYIDTATKDYIVTASRTVTDGSKVIGVMGIDIRLANITGMIEKMEVGYNGSPFVLSKEGVAIVHPTKRTENLMNLSYIKDMYDNKRKEGNIGYKADGDEKMLVYNTVPGTLWKVGAAYSHNDLMASAAKIRLNLAIISIIALVIAIAITYFVASNVTKPIVSLRDAVNKMANGDLRVKTEIKAKDELGDLSRHFNNMIKSMRNTLTVVQQSVDNVKASAENLSAISEEANAASEEMGVAINEISGGAIQSASEADIANQRSKHLGNQINDVNKQTEQMTTLAEKADEINQTGLEQVNNLKHSFEVSTSFLFSMEQVINDLEEKVKKIESVMTTITAISSQTNLLALNASIEAARAGEHGKGFAVVAEEVRKLAEQSVSATNEVKRTISDIQNGSLRAVEEMNRTKEIFGKQSEVVLGTEATFQTISDVVESMKQSILFIYREMGSIAGNKDEVISTIQTIAAMAEQSAASCEEVSASAEEQLRALQSVAGAAEQLTGLSNELREAVDKFILK